MKWILFDCFNTLVDDFNEEGDEWGMDCILDLPVRLGLYKKPEDFAADYREKRHQWFADPDSDELLLEERLLRLFGNDRQKEVAAIMNAFDDRFLPTTRLPAGTREMLDRVSTDHKLGVVSNFYIKDYVDMLLRHYGIREYFSFIIESGNLLKKKPGKDIYHAALARIPEDVERDEILFIGDSLRNDVIVPRSLGMQSLYFYRPAERKNIKEPPEDVDYIQSWDELKL